MRVGSLRTALLSSLPLLAEAAIAGEDRDEVCALAWINGAEVQRRLGNEPETDGEVIVDERLRAELATVLADFNTSSGSGSAAQVQRLLLLTRPADLDTGEMTDKGYLNQRRVLANRAHLVELLYAEPRPPGVITACR